MLGECEENYLLVDFQWIVETVQRLHESDGVGRRVGFDEAVSEAGPVGSVSYDVQVLDFCSADLGQRVGHHRFGRESVQAAHQDSCVNSNEQIYLNSEIYEINFC